MKPNPTESPENAIRILVVDDEPDIRDGCERILRRMDFDVLKAQEGEEALAKVYAQAPAIVLLDLKMPGIDGMEVLARIQQHDPRVMVIVITGYATVETAIEAMKKGAYDFIPKPFEPDQLRIVVNRAREKLRLTRETEKLAAERRKTLADLGTEKSRIRTIVESLPSGLMVTNALGQVVLMNPAFRLQLNLPEDAAAGQPIEAYILDEGFSQLVRESSAGRHCSSGSAPTYEFALSDERYLQARGRSVISEDNECLGAVVTVVDITTMKILDRLKSEFVATVSHELRSPLSTIHEQIALVLRDMVQGDSEREQLLLARAKEKTQGLISLIGDLLDLSRIESGSVCQEPKPVQLEDLLRGIVDFLSTRSNSRNQKLTLEVPPTPLPPLTADPLALESIFGNLITNAINYTPDGGEIRVAVEVAGNRVQVRVSDTGFGIEPDKLDRIFERFYRVKNDKTRFITGTGLGLSIVKGLVQTLRGAITVASEPGKGSTFTVTLPY